KDTMNVILKGGGVKDILNSLSKTLENPVLLKDHHFDEYTLDSTCDQNMYKQLEENLTTYFKGNTNVVRHSKTIFDKTVISEEEVDRIMVPIMVKNNIYGHLVTYGIRRELTSFDTLYMESTSNVIALEFLKRISVQDVENKYKAEFFEDLISLDQKRKEKAIDRANYYRFDKDASYNIISIRLSKTESKISTDEEYNQIVTKAMYVVDMICKNEGKTYLLANKGKKINILFMWKDHEDCKKNTSRIAEIVNETLRDKIETLSFKIGIGRMYDGIEDVNRSLQDAENAVEASKSYIDTEIIDFDELGIYKIFCQDNLKDELLSFYQSTLEPLVLYDRKRDTELVKSLTVYFETNGNLKKMSELLFTHYNTVLYRINRIQEITKKSLAKEMDRYGLQTALKIMKILDL
ncbi:MAG: helix-turn-helix domain-containing protein, partial [Acidaminobacteraceae bacterium]